MKPNGLVETKWIGYLTIWFFVKMKITGGLIVTGWNPILSHADCALLMAILSLTNQDFICFIWDSKLHRLLSHPRHGIWYTCNICIIYIYYIILYYIILYYIILYYIILYYIILYYIILYYIILYYIILYYIILYYIILYYIIYTLN